MDRIHASWRAAYVSDATEQSRNSDSSCVFCDLIERGVSKASGIVYLDDLVCCILNAYPYGSGHLLILPRRHDASLMALPLTSGALDGIHGTVRYPVAFDTVGAHTS